MLLQAIWHPAPAQCRDDWDCGIILSESLQKHPHPGAHVHATDEVRRHPIDSIQLRLSSYAERLCYEDLNPQTIHAAKVRVIDTLGALIGGFYGEAPQIAR